MCLQKFYGKNSGKHILAAWETMQNIATVFIMSILHLMSNIDIIYIKVNIKQAM